jgi:hypothetical protein
LVLKFKYGGFLVNNFLCEPLIFVFDLIVLVLLNVLFVAVLCQFTFELLLVSFLYYLSLLVDDALDGDLLFP